MPQAQRVPTGTTGFDTPSALDAWSARAFARKGYRFAMRYVRREQPHVDELSLGEIDRLHHAGLAVGIVQYVESALAWQPTPAKGESFGKTAASSCLALGLPSGVTVFCDLEGVILRTAAVDIITYLQAWHHVVAEAGFEPGLYVGWRNGLTADQLYRDLSFTRYYGAYNADSDQEPAVCGWCMKQREPKSPDFPADLHLMPRELSFDTVVGDRLGRLPMMYAPDEWDVVSLP